jgi:hypothetical protein
MRGPTTFSLWAMSHHNWESRLLPPHLCAIGSEDENAPGQVVSRTHREAPAQAGGTAHKGTARGMAKLANPAHGAGPRGQNPKRSEGLGHIPGGPRHKDKGTPAGHLGQGKSRYAMKKPT